MNERRPGNERWWDLAALALVFATAVALRYGTAILRSGPIFDEQYILAPIQDLMERGWSVATAIDYTETKGPTLIWLYAALGKLLGGSLNDLRLISTMAFVLGAVPLILIARRCGLRGPPVVAVAAFYVLLPHNAVLAQLLMSEPLFVCGALWLAWFFLWGLGTGDDRDHPILGPVLFGVVLCLLLHLRIHAVALGAAAMMVALERDRRRAWPWVAACAAAGLARLPLWFHWGGLVSPAYQSAHGLGLDLDGVTYMAAAMVPMTAVFLWPALVHGGERDARPNYFLGVSVGAAMLLALVASPSMTETMHILDLDVPRYMGLVSGAVRKVTGSPQVAALLLGGLAVAGAAGLGALGASAWSRPVRDAMGLAHRLQFWTLTAGCTMYALTRSVVYDRYLLPWAVLLPIAWVGCLPRLALIAEGLLLLVIQCRFVWRMLM